MLNQESYKNINIDDIHISDRIRVWASEQNIHTLYDLIAALNEEENQHLASSKHPADIMDVNSDDCNLIYLNDEDGNEIGFEFLDLIPYCGGEYVVLLPVSDDSTATDEVVILEVSDSSNLDEEIYTSVENEEILQAVFDIFKQKFKDEFDFI